MISRSTISRADFRSSVSREVGKELRQVLKFAVEPNVARFSIRLASGPSEMIEKIRHVTLYEKITVESNEKPGADKLQA